MSYRKMRAVFCVQFLFFSWYENSNNGRRKVLTSIITSLSGRT